MPLNDVAEEQSGLSIEGSGEALNKGRPTMENISFPVTIPDHLLNLWLPEELLGFHVKLFLNLYDHDIYSIYQGMIISVVPINEEAIHSKGFGHPKDMKALGYSIVLLYEDGTKSNPIGCWWYYNRPGFFTKRIIEIL